MKFRALLALVALIASCTVLAQRTHAQGANPLACALTSSITTCIMPPVSAYQACTVDVSGTWTGQLDFVVNGLFTPSPISAFVTNAITSGVTNTTSNGLWTFSIINAQTFEVLVHNPGAQTGTASVGIKCAPATFNVSGNNGSNTGVTVLNSPNVTASIGPITFATWQPVIIQTSVPLTVNTPAPAPTISPGLMTGVVMVGPSTAPAAINGTYTNTVDSSGNAAVKLCKSVTTLCAFVVGTNASNVLQSGLFPTTEATLSASSGVCTAVTTGVAVLYNIMFASGSAQTGTLTVYNEGASPTCTAADAVYVSVTHASATVPDLLVVRCSAGLAYEWTVAGEGGTVLLGYF